VAAKGELGELGELWTLPAKQIAKSDENAANPKAKFL
jgi:hypothetical protein